MEIDMFARRLSSMTRIALAAAAGLMLLSSASYADSRHEQLFPGGAHATRHYDARAHYQGGGNRLYEFSTPQDFVSSHVCINGYRYITRDLERWESPAQNAIPVRC